MSIQILINNLHQISKKFGCCNYIIKSIKNMMLTAVYTGNKKKIIE